MSSPSAARLRVATPDGGATVQVPAGGWPSGRRLGASRAKGWPLKDGRGDLRLQPQSEAGRNGSARAEAPTCSDQNCASPQPLDPRLSG